MVQRYNPDYKMHAVRFEAFAREAEHGEYVKFDAHQRAVSALEAERDAARNALASIYKTVTGELPEWSNWHAYLDDIVEEVGAAVAANQTADALAVENAALKDINAWCKTEALQNMYREFKTAEAIGCAEVDCMHDAMLVAIMHAPKTPATSAALAAFEVRGVEKLIKLKMEQLASMHPDTHAFGATAESLRAQINELQAFATDLREAK